MCDYSLMHLNTRLAENGETLVVHRFRTSSNGLISQEMARKLADTASSVGSCSDFTLCVTCVPHGTRVKLSLADVPVKPAEWWLVTTLGSLIQWAIRRSEAKPPATELSGTFCQLSAEAHVHRDAVRLDNGEIISLQQLREGVRLTVETVDSTEAMTPVAPETVVAA